MKPSTAGIYAAVLAAMQPAEELGGPEPDEYRTLMESIAAEAKRRVRALGSATRCTECGKRFLTAADGDNWQDYAPDGQWPTRCWSCAEAIRAKWNAPPKARFAPLKDAMVAAGWRAADLSVDHTGGNVYCLTLTLERSPGGVPTRHLLMGDPTEFDSVGGCIEDPRDGTNFADIDCPMDADDSAGTAAWLTLELGKHGYTP